MTLPMKPALPMAKSWFLKMRLPSVPPTNKPPTPTSVVVTHPRR